MTPKYVKCVPRVRLKQVREGQVQFAVEQVTAPIHVYQAVQKYYQGADREMLSVLCLDGRNSPTCFAIVSVGSLNTTRTRPADILKVAILSNALSIVLVHNHPSGALAASAGDIEFTKVIQKACSHLDISLYDHLIVTDEGYTSLREQGVL